MVHKALGTTRSFAIMGAASASLPASIPLRAKDLQVPVEGLLTSIPLLFFGLLMGIVITPLISSRIGSNKQVKIALIIQAIGVLGVGFSTSQNLFVVSAVVLGFGFGQLEVLITSILRITSEVVDKALTRIGAFLAFSAFLTPLLLLASDSIASKKLVFLFIFLWSGQVAFIFSSPDVTNSKQNVNILRNKGFGAYFLLFASIFYVGSETILAGWSAVFFEKNVSANLNIAPIGTSLFWLFLTLGRVSGSFVTGKFASAKTTAIFWSSGFSLALMLLPVVSENSGAFLVTLLLGVFFAGPCYGFIIGQAVSYFESDLAVKSASLYVLVGAVGGVVIPLAVQQTANGDTKKAIIGAAISAILASIFLIVSFREKVAKAHQS